MSASKTSLANEALALIRAKNKLNDIASDTEPNAQNARQFLDRHISEALEEYDWDCFSQTVQLTDITEAEPPPPGYLYRYTMPTNYIRGIQITHAGFIPNQTPIAFKKALLSSGTSYSILTNQNEAWLEYVSDSLRENVVLWPHHFRAAIIYQLAASLATAIKENPTMAGAMKNFAADSMNMAFHIDQSTKNIGESQTPKSIRRRRGSS